MARLVLVSNRLPVTLHEEHGRVALRPSSGGLATGLRGPHERSGGVWVGWPGDLAALDPRQRREFEALLEGLRAVPVELKPQEVQAFYGEFSNGILWPLFHYL